MRNPTKSKHSMPKTRKPIYSENQTASQSEIRVFSLKSAFFLANLSKKPFFETNLTKIMRFLIHKTYCVANQTASQQEIKGFSIKITFSGITI